MSQENYNEEDDYVPQSQMAEGEEELDEEDHAGKSVACNMDYMDDDRFRIDRRGLSNLKQEDLFEEGVKFYTEDAPIKASGIVIDKKSNDFQFTVKDHLKVGESIKDPKTGRRGLIATTIRVWYNKTQEIKQCVDAIGEEMKKGMGGSGAAAGGQTSTYNVVIGKPHDGYRLRCFHASQLDDLGRAATHDTKGMPLLAPGDQDCYILAMDRRPQDDPKVTDVSKCGSMHWALWNYRDKTSIKFRSILDLCQFLRGLYVGIHLSVSDKIAADLKYPFFHVALQLARKGYLEDAKLRAAGVVNANNPLTDGYLKTDAWFRAFVNDTESLELWDMVKRAATAAKFTEHMVRGGYLQELRKHLLKNLKTLSNLMFLRKSYYALAGGERDSIDIMLLKEEAEALRKKKFKEQMAKAAVMPTVQSKRKIVEDIPAAVKAPPAKGRRKAAGAAAVPPGGDGFSG